MEVQKVYNRILYFLGGILFIGAFLDSISNAISILTLDFAFWSTLFIIASWIILHIYIKRRGLEWKLSNGINVKVVAINSKVKLFLLGVILVLWLPSITNIFPINKERIQQGDIPKQTQMFDIIILPFNQVCDGYRDVGLAIEAGLEKLNKKYNLNLNIFYLDSIPFNDKRNFNATEFLTKAGWEFIIHGNYQTGDCTDKGNDKYCINYSFNPNVDLGKSIPFQQNKNDSYFEEKLIDDFFNGNISGQIDIIIHTLAGTIALQQKNCILAEEAFSYIYDSLNVNHYSIVFSLLDASFCNGSLNTYNRIMNNTKKSMYNSDDLNSQQLKKIYYYQKFSELYIRNKFESSLPYLDTLESLYKNQYDSIGNKISFIYINKVMAKSGIVGQEASTIQDMDTYLKLANNDKENDRSTIDLQMLKVFSQVVENFTSRKEQEVNIDYSRIVNVIEFSMSEIQKILKKYSENRIPPNTLGVYLKAKKNYLLYLYSKHNITETIEAWEEYIEFATNNNILSSFDLCQTYRSLGNYALINNRYKIAQKNLLKAVSIAEDNNMCVLNGVHYRAYGALCIIYKENNNIEKFEYYLNKYTEMKIDTFHLKTEYGLSLSYLTTRVPITSREPTNTKFRINLYKDFYIGEPLFEFYEY